jgi:hypothetical protein
MQMTINEFGQQVCDGRLAVRSVGLHSVLLVGAASHTPSSFPPTQRLAAQPAPSASTAAAEDTVTSCPRPIPHHSRPRPSSPSTTHVRRYPYGRGRETHRQCTLLRSAGRERTCRQQAQDTECGEGQRSFQTTPGLEERTVLSCKHCCWRAKACPDLALYVRHASTPRRCPQR